MEETNYAAIAKVTMHGREHIVVIRPRENGMTMHTMFYANEIRDVAEYGKTESAPPRDAEKKLAEQLIESLAAPFDPKKYRDEYQEQMKDMIVAKQEGRTVTAVQQPKLAPVIDLMDALRKSIASKEKAGGKKPPVRAVEPAAAPAAQKRKRSAG